MAPPYSFCIHTSSVTHVFIYRLGYFFYLMGNEILFHLPFKVFFPADRAM